MSAVAMPEPEIVKPLRSRVTWGAPMEIASVAAAVTVMLLVSL